MTQPFEDVYQRILDLVPNLELQPGKAMQAVRLIQEWLLLDADAEIIIPAINIAFARCAGKITSPSYFDKPIRMAIEEKTNSASHQERLHDSKVRTIRIKQKAGMYVNDEEEIFLRNHESNRRKDNL